MNFTRVGEIPFVCSKTKPNEISVVSLRRDPSVDCKFRGVHLPRDASKHVASQSSAAFPLIRKVLAWKPPQANSGASQSPLRAHLGAFKSAPIEGVHVAPHALVRRSKRVYADPGVSFHRL